MFWKGIFTFFCVTFVPSYAIISCHYNFDEFNNLYICNMMIFNPTGGAENSIIGNHLPNKTDADIVQVIATGITPNIPPIICNNFQNLQKLELESLGVSSLPNNPFLNCKKLDMLSLSNNNISSLSAHMFMNTVLEELYLDKNSFTEITSDELQDLNNLQILSFKGNEHILITGSAFEHLANLTDLNLSSCNITELNPEWFERGLSQLEVLNLYGNLLTEIPAHIFEKLTGLEVLALDFNEISILHEDSFAITGLRALFLDSNMLEELQENVFGNLESLEILYLSENNCSNLPPNIFKPLTSLTTLGMHSCSIKNIKPEWFQSLPNLSILLLEENEIKEFPERAFKSSNRFSFLSLYGNQLSVLNSRSFGSLEFLTHLDVRHNQINAVDYHFMNQSNVIKIALFSENICAQFDTINYDLQSDVYKEELKNCFDNFDKTPIVLETNNAESYEWYNIRPNDGWESIELNITAPESVHIGLTDSLKNQDPLIEIRIGEDRNTLVKIIERGEEKLSQEHINLLSDSEMRTFKIQWRLRTILLYKNNESLPFFGHFIQTYFPVNFFGFRTQIQPTGSVESAFWSALRIQE